MWYVIEVSEEVFQPSGPEEDQGDWVLEWRLMVSREPGQDGEFVFCGTREACQQYIEEIEEAEGWS